MRTRTCRRWTPATEPLHLPAQGALRAPGPAHGKTMLDASSPNGLLGRLSLDALPLHEPILIGAFIAVAVLGLAAVGVLTWLKRWGWLWREWLTSVDHKKIGIMYIVLGIIMLLRGFSDALMMRAQQAMAFGAN